MLEKLVVKIVRVSLTFIQIVISLFSGLWAIVHNFNLITPPSIFEWTNPAAITENIDITLCKSILLTQKLLPWIRRSKGRVVMTTIEGHVGFPTWLEHQVVSGGIQAFCSYLR